MTKFDKSLPGHPKCLPGTGTARPLREGLNFLASLRNSGNGMISRPIMVLLVGGNPAGFLEALSWLYKRGCRCHFATSFDDACRLISCAEFDLVLSQYHFTDRTAFSLYERLAVSQATLFLSQQVESGCVWVPQLECGRSCIGAQEDECPSNPEEGKKTLVPGRHLTPVPRRRGKMNRPCYIRQMPSHYGTFGFLWPLGARIGFTVDF